MKDLSDLHFFLGLEIKYLKHGGLFVSQYKYATNLLHKASPDECHTYITPCQFGVKLFTDSGTPLSSADTSLFQSLVGCLQYLTFTKLDIAYVVNYVCQFLHCPTTDHLLAAKRILRYLKGTIDYSICFRRGIDGNVDALHTSCPKLTLHAFCDVN